MTDGKRETTAAIVVTYNRKALLARCLTLLLQQTHPLDAIHIVDNCSTDGTYDDLLSRDLIGPASAADGVPGESIKAIPLQASPGQDVEIHYVRMPENTGGAGGFHEGMRRGLEAGYDWLWLMDDDLSPSPEALETLIKKKDILMAAQGPSFLLNSLVLSQDHRDGQTLAFPLQELSTRGYPKTGVYHWRLSDVQNKIERGLYRWACPFNGTFVPTSALPEIGLPNADFFLKGDEKDFLWRAARKLDLYTVIDSKVYHPKPPAGVFDWKQYYNIRNMFVVNRHFNFTAIRNLRLIALSLMMGVRHGRGGMRLVLRAIKDGLSGRLGKRDDVHTWLNTS